MTTIDHDSPPRTSWVCRFGDADPAEVGLLGGKGAGLARMSRAGLTVPAGFIITTRACLAYVAAGAIPEDVLSQVRDEIAALEQDTERTFGGGPLPLLVSVRSGAPVSMPGMMDTILNLGLNRRAAIALAQATGDPAFVLDVTRRFHRGFAEIVLGADPDLIDDAVADFGSPAGDFADTYDRYWSLLQAAVADDVDAVVPDEPWQQLEAAIEAVLRSWDSPRAVTYREHQKISHDLGTAVVVQSMVFGNLGSPSGTGVAFTRNPVSGERALYGEFLEGGQGEDVVAGTADPEPIEVAAKRLPEVFAKLSRVCEELEVAYGDALDIEYTVERGQLYMLQVRSAKRTPEAAIKIAAEMLWEGRLDALDAVGGVSGDHIRWVQRPSFDEQALADARAAEAVIAAGIGASPGQVTGKLVLDSDRAVEQSQAGEGVILARPVTSPLDLHGLLTAAGVITARGGATSHAAVVARALAKPCVVGCASLAIDEPSRTLTVGDRVLSEGDDVAIDGQTGELFAGSVAVTRVAASSDDLTLLMERADEASGCEVLARATTPQQVEQLLEQGATGVVTSVDDVLATTGHLVDVLEAVVRGGKGAATLEEAVTEAFTPLLGALGNVDIDVRAIDVRADEARELLPQALLDAAPRLSLPVGDVDLLRAQMRGLALAADRSGYGSRPRLAVRHVSDPQEARAIHALGEELEHGQHIPVGIYVTSPRALMRAPELAAESEVMWVEVRALQAAMFGIPASQFLTAQPLDDYMRRGLLSVDPRSDIDPMTYELLAEVARARKARPGCRIGMRLSGPVSDDIARHLYGLGFRLFAVGPDELRVARLALGKAAWARA